MTREAQDPSRELLFLAPLQSANRRHVTGCTHVDRNGQRGGTGLCNFLPLVQPATSPMRRVTAHGPNSQYVRRST